MEKRESIKELLKILKEQESATKQRNGITSIVYYTLLATILWNLINESTLGQINILQVNKYYGCALNIFILFFVCFQPVSTNELRNRFRSGRPENTTTLFTFLISSALLLTLSNILTTTHESFFSAIGILWGIQSAILTINFLIVFILIYLSYRYEKKSGLPSPYDPGAGILKKKAFKISLTLHFFLLVAFIGALISAIILKKNINEIRIGIELGAIHILSFLLATHLNETHKSNRLAEIELSVYLGEDGIEEIERKIKYEIIGVYVGEFIKERLISLRQLAEENLELIKSSRTDLEEIKKIDKKYLIEIEGRIKKMLTNIGASSNNLRNSSEKITSWIINYQKFSEFNDANSAQQIISDEINAYKKQISDIDMALEDFENETKIFLQEEINKGINPN